MRTLAQSIRVTSVSDCMSPNNRHEGKIVTTQCLSCICGCHRVCICVQLQSCVRLICLMARHVPCSLCSLGKTVQVISYICHLLENGQLEKPFLVVAPASVVPSWAHEFQSWAPGLRVVAYRGTAVERAAVISDQVRLPAKSGFSLAVYVRTWPHRLERKMRAILGEFSSSGCAALNSIFYQEWRQSEKVVLGNLFSCLHFKYIMCCVISAWIVLQP